MEFANQKLFEYQFTELRFLQLTSPLTGNQPLVTNQRAYFAGNQKLKGKRVIGIDIMANVGSNIPWNNSYAAINSAALNTFMLTLVDYKGEEVIKNFPLKDLHRFQTFGKIRLFNQLVDLEKSYVIHSSPGVIINPNLGILFNFYTTEI